MGNYACENGGDCYVTAAGSPETTAKKRPPSVRTRVRRTRARMGAPATTEVTVVLPSVFAEPVVGAVLGAALGESPFYNVISMFACAERCLEHDDCAAFDYSPLLQKCHITSATAGSNNGDVKYMHVAKL